MVGRVLSEATIEPVMTEGVDTTGLRDGGFDRDSFGHRAEFRRIGSPSAAATRLVVTCMRGGLWSGEPEISMARELEVSMAGLTQFIGSR
jgi:hypothetical protein